MGKDWKKTLIEPSLSIVEAMRLIDEAALQIALVIDENNQLLGTVTDGDIRRAILKGSSLEEPVSNIMNTRPTTFQANESRQDMLTAMRLLNISRVPVVDTEHKIVYLEVLDSLARPAPQDNPVVLMAGGLGTRLYPLTESCPKPLLKVGNKPVLETIIKNFISFGFHNFYVSVNYRADMIEKYFGDGKKWGVSIKYIHEPQRLGTAGALGLLPDAPQEPIIVMNGDILTKVNFLHMLEFHKDQRVKATMCVRKYDLQIPYGVVKADKQRLKAITEKPTHNFFINAGIYVLDPEALEQIPKKTFFDMPSLFDKLLHQNEEPGVFPIREYWLDIGQKHEFEQAQDEFSEFFSNAPLTHNSLAEIGSIQ